MSGPSFKNDMRHAAETHHRWMPRRNRRQEAPDYQDGWWVEQCGACRFWIPISGALGHDYGACSNAASRFDSTVRFEHDGCESFQQSNDGWGQPDQDA
ncbi:MAG: DUF3027 domain-containing protein [Acidimicrobiaceae bacterium]|nr:DUF3027 domain-containing protein [Acidimicrobiaceae bacterium]